MYAALIALMAGSSSQVVSPLPNISDNATSMGTAIAGLRVGADGKCYQRTNTTAYVEIAGAAWHKSPAAGVGVDYWVKFIYGSGDSPTNIGTYFQLNADRSFELDSDIGTLVANGTWVISTTNSDSGIVATAGNWDLTASNIGGG